MTRAMIMMVAGALSLWGCADPNPDTIEEPYGGGEGGGGGDGDDPGDDDDDDDDGDGDDGDRGDGHGGGGEPDDDDGDDGEGEGGGCVPSEEFHVLQATPASVMLVLDKSGSMSWTWDHDENPSTSEVSKWSSLHAAVTTILEGYGDKMGFGAQLFPQDAVPQGYEEACLINPLSPEVPVAMNNVDAVLAGIPGAEADVHGGTPASAGFDSAVAHLLGQSEDSPRHVILVTDGAANCKAGEQGQSLNDVYDDTLPSRVALAREEHQIYTHAIGVDMVDELIPVPYTNPWQSLNAVGEAGGAPKSGPDAFYNVISGIELSDAMATISGHIECTIPLAAEVELPDTMNVMVNAVAFGQATDCNTMDGWAYTTPEAPFDAIRLCGAACNPDQAITEVEISYGCP